MDTKQRWGRPYTVIVMTADGDQDYDRSIILWVRATEPAAAAHAGRVEAAAERVRFRWYDETNPEIQENIREEVACETEDMEVITVFEGHLSEAYGGPASLSQYLECPSVQ